MNGENNHYKVTAERECVNIWGVITPYITLSAHAYCKIISAYAMLQG